MSSEFNNSEFNNILYDVDKTMRHCFRSQAARCHEYTLFLNRMKVKYPDIAFENDSSATFQLPFVTTSNWKGLEKQFKHVDGFDQNDRSIFAVKYTRMLEARKLFERLNGNYEKFR